MKLSVFITYAHGRLTFDTHGVAPCTIWAEVGMRHGNPAIASVYIESDFDDTCIEIKEDWNNQVYCDACAILECNDEWWAWAYHEVERQSDDYAVNKRIDDAKHAGAAA